MALRINSNTTALNAHSNLVKNESRLSRAPIERLSSGLRINRASDDAQGLLFLKNCALRFAVFRELS